MFGADELRFGYLMPVLETPPSNVQINMYAGSMGPISGKWGAPPGWGLAEQQFWRGWGCDTLVTPPCLLACVPTAQHLNVR